MAQISEFSLILGALGLSLGHIDAETMGLITLVGLITISASTYMIIFSHELYERLAPWLRVFEHRRPHRESGQDTVPQDGATEIIVFGAGRYGSGIVQALRKRGCRVVTVDYNPELVRAARTTGHKVLYGDAEDPEFIASLPLARTHWVVSTMREEHIGRALIHGLRSSGYAGRVAVTAHSSAEAARLEQAGSDLVLLPFVEAARGTADRLLGPQQVVLA